MWPGKRTERIQVAARTRQAIAQAQGVIMERRGISEDDAYTVLRIASQRSGRSLHDHANEVISSSLRRGRGRRSGSVGDPMAEPTSDTLDRFRRQADLSRSELWLRYFELGGMSTALQLEAFLYGALRPSSHDHDVIAHALNERFVELGVNFPVPRRRRPRYPATATAPTASTDPATGSAPTASTDPATAATATATAPTASTDPATATATRTDRSAPLVVPVTQSGHPWARRCGPT